MKQSAVEWLEEKLSFNNGFGVRYPIHIRMENLNSYFEQAKEIEKKHLGYSREDVLSILHEFYGNFYKNSINIDMTRKWFQEFEINNLQLNQTKLEDCNISNRLLNCLKAMDLVYLEQLKKIRRSDIKKYRNFGEKSQKELCDLMESYGIKFLGQ
jgi:DNA-directed RNA polymerase alpha subunit